MQTDSDFLHILCPSIWPITSINSDVSGKTLHVIVNLTQPVLNQRSINTSPNANLPLSEFQSSSTATTSTLNSTSIILPSSLVFTKSSKCHNLWCSNYYYQSSYSRQEKHDTFNEPIFIESGIVPSVLNSSNYHSVLNTVAEIFDTEHPKYKTYLIS